MHAEPARPQDGSAAVAVALLAEAAAAAPAAAERLAEAAIGSLERLEREPAASCLGLLLRGGAILLRSRRLQGKLRLAGDAYRHMLPYLALAAPGVAGRAHLLAALARLRAVERREDEAVALLHEAGAIALECSDDPGVVCCCAQGGFLRCERRDLLGAQRELGLADATVDPRMAPALAGRVALALAWCLAAEGGGEREADLVEDRLAAARALQGHVTCEGERLSWQWWEARIACVRGDRDQADAGLESVRQRLLARGSLAEAASATVDLVAHRVATGRAGEVGHAAHDLLAAFGHALAAVQPANMIAVLSHLGARGASDFSAALAATRHYLAGLRAARGGRPPLIPDVLDVAEEVLIASWAAADGSGRHESAGPRGWAAGGSSSGRSDAGPASPAHLR